MIPVFSRVDVFGEKHPDDSPFGDDCYDEYADGDEYESENNGNLCEDTEYDCDDELPFL